MPKKLVKRKKELLSYKPIWIGKQQRLKKLDSSMRRRSKRELRPRLRELG